MLRRSFISATLLGIGAVGGYVAGLGVMRRNAPWQSPEQFQKAMQHVRLDFVTRDLLLKLYSKAVGEGDRLQLIRELVNHNSQLYMVYVPGRVFGEPGYYRLVE